ncbi:MAG: DUF6056 family protein [bacterium]|nr:DUF6056 family protein [Mycoplasmatota bacterium]MDD6757274.1 DUF6056 family protein [bacterium]MDY2908585.1 DUF6056 family protein [Candidatus Faecimonas sp.]
MKSKKIDKTKISIIVILGLIYISMLILNFITPLIMDDYNYAFGLNGRLNSISDIFNYQIWFYLNWGGRNVAHFIAQLFLMNNKIIFNIINPIIYTLMVYLIYNLIKGKNKHNPLYLILIHFALWFFTPVFGQSFIWLTGASNYLWTTTIILIFLNIFIHLETSSKKYNIVQIVLFGILGIIAGWTNENSGASLLFMLIAYIIMTKLIEKRKLKKIHVAGITGALIGFIIMIAAPGNYVRSSGFEDNSFFIIKWIKRAISITQTGERYLLCLAIISVVLISIYIYKKQKINKKIFIYFIGLIIAMYSMIASPTFPERSWTIIIIYAIIINGILLYNLEIKNQLKKFILIDCIIVAIFIFANSYILAFKDSYQFYNVWKSRAEEIEEGKKKRIEDYQFEPYFTTRKQSASFALGDIYENKKDINNQIYARFFDVKSISASTNE